MSRFFKNVQDNGVRERYLFILVIWLLEKKKKQSQVAGWKP
jgi:hypothetical protein